MTLREFFRPMFPALIKPVPLADLIAEETYEAVAATLGARPTTVLRRVTLPLVLPGLASGAVVTGATPTSSRARWSAHT